MKKCLLLLCSILFLANLETARATAHAFIWDSTDGFRDLGSLGVDSIAFAVNDSGTVTGYYVPVDKFYQHGFVWTAATGMVDIGIPGGGDSTTAVCRPTAINAAGHIVGYGRQVDGTQVAFYWTSTEGFTTLGTLSGSPDNGNTAYAINDLDQVTGNLRFRRSPSYHAYLWSPGMPAPRDLGTVDGGDYSVGYGINNSGRIVGAAVASNSTVWQVMNWMRRSGMTILGTIPDSIYAQGVAVNDAGQAIGISFTDTSGVGFYKSARGEIKFLGGLGGNIIYATAINQQGIIIGSATDTTGKTNAVMWPTPGGRPVELETLDPAFSTASVYGINNLGQIVGEYFPQ